MKNNATNSPVLTLVYGAAIAAIYVVLTMVFLPISFGRSSFGSLSFSAYFRTLPRRQFRDSLSDACLPTSLAARRLSM